MKIYYFLKNITTGEYYLDQGAFTSHREVLGKDKDFIWVSIKKKVNLKRESEFYVMKEGLSEAFITQLQKFFSNSKVKVKLENKFE